MVKPKFNISSWSTQVRYSSTSPLEDELPKDTTTESFSVRKVRGHGHRSGLLGLLGHRWEPDWHSAACSGPVIGYLDWIPIVNDSPAWLVVTVTLWDASVMQHTF